jgi:hypothetical protein
MKNTFRRGWVLSIQNIYITLFAVTARSGFDIKYSINTATDHDEARANALLMIGKNFGTQGVQVLNTTVIPDEAVDLAYESRH